MIIILSLIVLILSVVVHEVSHGIAAEKFGDNTAKYLGRLTLNPIPHIDLFGSILLPAFLWFATNGQFVLGAAKPVPVNFANLKNPKRDMVLVSLAGPGSNLILALASGISFKLGFLSGDSFASAFLLYVMWLNLILAIFNLIPIPPLDGSKVVAGLLSDKYLPGFLSLERYGFLLVLAFLFLGLFNLILIPALGVLVPLFSGFSLNEAIGVLFQFGFLR